MREPIIATGAITADGASFAMREWAHGAMDWPPLRRREPRVFALIEALHDPANADHAAVYRAHDAEIVE